MNVPGAEHVGDDADLYALGVLDVAERARIDAHLRTCGACSQAVGEAERAILALDSANALGVAQASPVASARYAIAAAFALLVGAVATLASQNARLARANHADDLAFVDLATTHFAHASFVPRTPGAPLAKIVYDRRGAWAFVVVAADVPGWQLLAGDATRPRELGVLEARGATSVLALRPAPLARAGRSERFELRDPTGVIRAVVLVPAPRSVR